MPSAVSWSHATSFRVGANIASPVRPHARSRVRGRHNIPVASPRLRRGEHTVCPVGILHSLRLGSIGKKRIARSPYPGNPADLDRDDIADRVGIAGLFQQVSSNDCKIIGISRNDGRLTNQLETTLAKDVDETHADRRMHSTEFSISVLTAWLILEPP
jgi:hypothetical protein